MADVWDPLQLVVDRFDEVQRGYSAYLAMRDYLTNPWLATADQNATTHRYTAASAKVAAGRAARAVKT